MANIVENLKNGNLVKGPLGEFLADKVENETAKTALKVAAAVVDLPLDLLKGVANAPNSITELKDKAGQGDSVAENVGNIVSTAAAVVSGGNFLANRAVASGISSGDSFVNLFDPAFKNDNKPMPKKKEEDKAEAEDDSEDNAINMQPHNPAAQDSLLQNVAAKTGPSSDLNLEDPKDSSIASMGV